MGRLCAIISMIDLNIYHILMSVLPLTLNMHLFAGITHFIPLIPENIRKPEVFLMLSGGIERGQWHEMGSQ